MARLYFFFIASCSRVSAWFYFLADYSFYSGFQMNMTWQSHRTAAAEEVAQRFAESFSAVSLCETSAPAAVKSGRP